MKYETGSKAEVIRSLVRYAIRDQEALIEAFCDKWGEPGSNYETEIGDCEATIRDFKRLEKVLLKGLY